MSSNDPAFDSVTTLNYPLIAVGELPPNVCAAFNAAVFCAQWLEDAWDFLAKSETIEIDRTTIGLFAYRVSQFQHEKDPCGAALSASRIDLNRARIRLNRTIPPEAFQNELFKGDMVAANAHQTAYELALATYWEIWRITDHESYYDSATLAGWPDNNTVTHDGRRYVLDIDLIESRMDELRQRFRGLAMPNFNLLLREMELEACETTPGTLAIPGIRPPEQEATPSTTPLSGQTGQDSGQQKKTQNNFPENPLVSKLANQIARAGRDHRLRKGEKIKIARALLSDEGINDEGDAEAKSLLRQVRRFKNLLS